MKRGETYLGARACPYPSTVGGMRRASLLAPVLLTAALALAGCSGPSDSGSDPSDEPTQNSAPMSTGAAEAATGETVTGSGYSYSTPQGWAVPTDETLSAGADSFAADLQDTDGFADNVNVILSPAGEITPDQVETQGASELEGVGATEVEVLDRVDLAGSESAHLSAVLTSTGVPYRIEQFYAVNDGETFIVTFSFSETVSADDRAAITDTVLASWQWA